MNAPVDTERMKTWKVVVLTVCGTIFTLIVLTCAGSPYWQGFARGFFR